MLATRGSASASTGLPVWTARDGAVSDVSAYFNESVVRASPTSTPSVQPEAEHDDARLRREGRHVDGSRRDSRKIVGELDDRDVWRIEERGHGRRRAIRGLARGLPRGMDVDLHDLVLRVRLVAGGRLAGDEDGFAGAVEEIERRGVEDAVRSREQLLRGDLRRGAASLQVHRAGN